jgi:soluble lytic murein transglycosylase-like protein
LETGSRRLGVLQSLQPPDTIQRLIKAANLNLDNAIALGPHDPSTPQATEKQLRNWYGRNTPIPGERNGAKPINPNKELTKQIDNLRQMTTEVFDVTTKPVKMPRKAADYTKAPRYAEVAPVVQSAASRYGVPPQLALALVGKESTFNPSAQGPVIKSGTHAGDRAMGLGQVMAKTAAAYGVADRASLDVAGQADLAMRVLADNYKKTGDWKDAVSMYFTGTTYAKAKAQGRTDGFNSVMQYVEGITG